MPFAQCVNSLISCMAHPGSLEAAPAKNLAASFSANSIPPWSSPSLLGRNEQSGARHGRTKPSHCGTKPSHSLTKPLRSSSSLCEARGGLRRGALRAGPELTDFLLGTPDLSEAPPANPRLDLSPPTAPLLGPPLPCAQAEAERVRHDAAPDSKTRMPRMSAAFFEASGSKFSPIRMRRNGGQPFLARPCTWSL